MERLPLFDVMDDLTSIVNSTPIEKAPEELFHRANLAGSILGMEALCHLFVLASARCRHAEAKYLQNSMELEALKGKINEF